MKHESPSEVEKRVRSCLLKIGPYGGLEASALLSGAPGWDSLRSAEWIIALQNEFGVKFTVPEMIRMASVHAAVECVSAALARSIASK